MLPAHDHRSGVRHRGKHGWHRLHQYVHALPSLEATEDPNQGTSFRKSEAPSSFVRGGKSIGVEGLELHPGVDGAGRPVWRDAGLRLRAYLRYSEHSAGGEACGPPVHRTWLRGCPELVPKPGSPGQHGSRGRIELALSHPADHEIQLASPGPARNSRDRAEVPVEMPEPTSVDRRHAHPQIGELLRQRAPLQEEDMPLDPRPSSFLHQVSQHEPPPTALVSERHHDACPPYRAGRFVSPDLPCPAVTASTVAASAPTTSS